LIAARNPANRSGDPDARQPPSLIVLLWENSPHPALVAESRIFGPEAEAGHLVGKCRHATPVDVDANSPRSRFPQWWRLRHEVQELARCVDLIIERAVRELLEFALIRLAPGRTLGQPDSAAVDHVDVVKKSRGLRAAIRWNELKLERAKPPLQITKKSLTVPRPFDQDDSGLTIDHSLIEGSADLADIVLCAPLVAQKKTRSRPKTTLA
jgi:hypothetical protein